MSVTVGRLVYEIGADGRVLEREMHDAAKKTGKEGGKELNDSMVEEFRRRWGGPSGFAKSLSKTDQKVVAHFNKLGHFTSKAYADRFEKSLRPRYAATAKKLAALFNKYTADGTVIDLSRTFKGGPEMDAQIRRTKELLDELAQAFQLGLADTPEGFNVDALNRYRAALEKVIVATDGATGAMDARNDALDRQVDLEEIALRAMDRYADLSDKELRQAKKSADAQEKEISAGLKALDVLKKQTAAKADLNRTRIANLKTENAELAVAQDTAKAELRRLASEVLSIQNGKLLSELGKKKSAQARELIALMDVERLARVKMDKRVTRNKETIEKNNKALGDHLSRLREISVEISNTQLHYDEAVNKLQEMTSVTQALGKAQKKAKDATTEQGDAIRDTTRAVTEAVVVQEKLVSATERQRHAIAAMLEDRGEFAEITRDRQIELGVLQEIEVVEERLTKKQRKRLEAAAAASLEVAEATDEVGRASERARFSLDGLGLSFRKNSTDAHAFGGAMDYLGKKLSKVGTSTDLNARAIVGIVAVLGEPIAVLGGSLGPALLAVGGAATAAIGGIVALVGVFSTLSKDLGELPAELQGAARAFQDLKRDVGGLGEVLAAADPVKLEGGFDRLRGTIGALTPAISGLGKEVADLIFDLGSNLRPGQRGFEELNRLIEDMGPLFSDIARTSGDFLLALITGFNRANPQVQKFVGWLDDLVETFDEFVQGPGFDEWVGHSVQIFESLNKLLSATGTMLNNLVTNESVDRTSQFIDNLAAFAPHLENIIRFFGELDVLGLASQALVDFGDAMMPLVPALQLLAEQIGPAFSTVVSGMADSLSLVTSALNLVVVPLATFVAALPPPLLYAIGGALAFVAVGLTAVSTAKGLITGVARLKDFVAQLTYIPEYGSKADRAVGKLGKGLAALDKVAVIGGIAAAFVGLTEILGEVVRDVLDIDGVTRNLVATNSSLADSYKKLNSDAQGNMLAPMIKDWDAALDGLAGTGDVFGNLASAFKEGGQEALALSGVLGELDKGISGLPLEKASEQFGQWAAETGASNEQILAMLDKMPEFKQRLEESAAASGKLATDQELVAAAIEGATAPTQTNTELLESMGAAAQEARGYVSDLAESIRNFGNDQISTIEAQSAFEGAIDDVTQSLKENGLELDLNEEAGRLNTDALLTAVQAAKDHASAKWEESGSLEEVNGVLATQKERLRDTIKEMDAAGYEAGLYDDILAGIPDDVETVAEFEDTVAQREIDALTRDRYVKIIASVFPNPNARAPLNPYNDTIWGASGALVNSPQIWGVGEAGPEAIVPLRRPLSQVDPAVRALSAIAQGKALPQMQMQMAGAPSKVVTFADGAIVVQGSFDPRRAAIEVANEIAQRVGS